MFSYCNNNPVCCCDPTGKLTDGQIHDSVLAAIIMDYYWSGYYSLSMTDNMVYYNGRNIWEGWGYCDLYDLSTGEVWELKKDSSSYSCTTKYAKRQLGRYVNGRLRNHQDLVLSRGGDIVFGKNTYSIKDAQGTYTITYWQECEGILRYTYTFQKGNDQQAIQRTRLNLVLFGCAAICIGFGIASGTATTLIPFVPAFIEQVSKVA